MAGYGFGDESLVGGFINNSTIDNFGTGKKKGVRRLQSVVPVVIRMLKNFHGHEFKLFGLPVQIVSVVGVLQSYDLQSTKATYMIQDHTGTIKAVWWVDRESDDDNVQLPDVKEGTYVKIFGTIKIADAEKSLLVLKMFPVDDLNIVSTHLLEVINSRLRAEAFSRDSVKTIKQNNPGASLANAMTSMNETVNNDQQANMTPIQLKIFRILQADNSQSGPHKDTIFQQFPSHQIREANAALAFLVNEGHAYSTVDNDHFKPTDT